jgi:hypothetical protein
VSEDGWVTTPVTPDLLHGAVEVERATYGVVPHRLPAWARAQAADPQLAMAESQPSGVRLAFRTSADTVEIVVLPTKRAYVGAPPRPDGVVDVVVDGALVAQAPTHGGNVLGIDLATGTVEHTAGAPGTLVFPGLGDRPKEVEIWLPHNETVEVVELRTDGPVHPARGTDRRRWVHHGSSISQGSDAASPTGTWPAVAALASGAELTNLGFGGSALLDPFVARVMRDTPADLLSVKVGINVVNTDLMRRRAFGPAVHGFLDTIRDGHPTTPLLVVSPIWCGLQEQTPGPLLMDLGALGEGRMGFVATGDPAEVAAGKLTLEVVREELARIVAERAATDPHLHLLDGLELYGEADHRDLPLPDGLHPDATTHRLMGERFVRLALEGAWGRDAPSG